MLGTVQGDLSTAKKIIVKDLLSNESHILEVR